MIPVRDDLITPLEIDSQKDTYESNEIRYLRKNWGDIESKAKKVYNERKNSNSPHFSFLDKACCDFVKLENALHKFKK